MRGLERVSHETAAADGIESHEHASDAEHPVEGYQRGLSTGGLKRTINNVLPIESLPFYVKHPAFLASLALSLLYFTVLSFSGQMITYLISVGYSSFHVAIARIGSSIFEISATWAAPYLMKRIGVVRAGIWSLTWQMACLAGALGWYLSNFQGLGTNSIFSATGLAVGVALSRMGLWGYDLSAQTIIQDVSQRPAHQSHSALILIEFVYRKSKMITAGRSRPWKAPSRTSSRCCPTLRRSSSRGRISSNIQSSSPLQQCILREGCMLTS